MTIAQDEATCVVFGMPNEAIKLNGVDKILPLQSVAGRNSHPRTVTRGMRQPRSVNQTVEFFRPGPARRPETLQNPLPGGAPPYSRIGKNCSCRSLCVRILARFPQLLRLAGAERGCFL